MSIFFWIQEGFTAKPPRNDSRASFSGKWFGFRPESQSYRPKVGVTDQKSELQWGRPPESEPNRPEKKPRIGFRCFYRKPPLRVFSLYFPRIHGLYRSQKVQGKGCLIKGCLNSTRIPKAGIPTVGIPKTGIPRAGENPHWDPRQDRFSKARDSEVRDSEDRDSEARDSENGHIQGPLNSDTP